MQNSNPSGETKDYVINQPVEMLLPHLERLFAQDFNLFTFVVAYAKRSGTVLIREHLEGFKERGGYIKGIVGIDQRNTSIEALRDLMSLCDELFVYHCEDMSQTFHPKLYYFNRSEDKAEIIFGSSNLTNGGLQRNTELNTGMRLLHSLEEDRVKILRFNEIISSYLENRDLCKPLTNDLLIELIDKAYILPERIINVSIRGQNSRNESGGSGVRIFGRGRNLFGLRRVAQDAETESNGEINIEEVDVTGYSTYTFTGNRFWKKLSANDVSMTSSPGQIIIPIRFLPLLPPFTNAQLKPNGARQEESFFNLLFIDYLGNRIPVINARAILYTPAPTHPRPNREIRFTFRNRGVSNLLEPNDILLFDETNESGNSFVVRQYKTSNTEYSDYVGRFGGNA